MVPSKLSKVSKNADVKPRYFTNMASGIDNSQASSRNLNRIRPTTNTNRNSTAYSHLPLPDEPTGLYDTLITDSDMALSKRKFVKVTSSGEIEVEPDKIEYCIKVTTSKTDMSQAKESIKKRKDYILAVLKKFRVQDHDIIVSAIVRKECATDKDEEAIADDDFLEECIDGNDDLNPKMKRKLKKMGASLTRGINQPQPVGNDNPDQYCGAERKERLVYFEEIFVKCESLLQFLRVFSICNEKLDRYVEISRPVVRFSPERIQIYTQRAVRLAMNNSILKANELISTMRQRVALGRLYYSVEDSLVVDDVQDYESNDNFETFTWKRLNKFVKCCLTSVFELEYPKTPRIQKII